MVGSETSVESVAGRRAGDDNAGATTAIIVVHGVADQRPGETAGAVSRQVASIVGGLAREVDWPVNVLPVSPARAYPGQPDPDWRTWIRKSLAQSRRSDFLAHARDGEDKLDLGARFTDYLFWKARTGTSDPRQRSEAAPHVARGFEIRDGRRPVDVFEMYWADLSRLSGSTPRVLSELFTLLFNLSRLGAGTVALAGEVHPGNRPIGHLAGAQRVAHWLFSRILAVIFLQLTLCILLIGVAALPERSLINLVTALVFLIPVVYCSLRIFLPAPRTLAGAGVTLLAVAADALLLYALAADAVVSIALPMIWMAILFGLQGLLLVQWERRFRGVVLCGGIAAMVVLAAGLWGVFSHGGPALATAWIAGALRAADVLLLLLDAYWCGMPFVLLAVLGCGFLAIRSAGAGPLRDQVWNTVCTGWLGLMLSLGVFIAFGMVSWAALARPLHDMVLAIDYRPIRFGGLLDGVRAGVFLDSHFHSATFLFAFIAMCVGSLVSLMVVVLLPSILVELRALSARAARDLQEWLTGGYRVIDQLIPLWIAVLVPGICFGAVLTEFNAWNRLWGTDPPELISVLIRHLMAWSDAYLSWLVLLLVGTTTGLIAIGSLTLKWSRALRGPLDIALDVDNHFREFPRRAIPRVAIFERFIAELEGVLERGYPRVIIVAHSQGGVITAELLRYLQQRSMLPASPQSDRLAKLGAALRNADLSLLTVGCPLRQLYARRFPDLYHWVVAGGPDGTSGPDRAGLGLQAWVNRWGAGDYVGRWLWERGGRPVDEPGPASPDQCVGAFAHLRYFEPDQSAIIATLRRLLAGAAPGDPA